jgi:type IV pilus assembly protein PilF
MKMFLIAIGVAILLNGCVVTTAKLGSKDDVAAASYNLQLGTDYFQQGNLALAKEKLDRSLEQNPKNAQTYVVAGLLYDRLNESKKANEYFNKAVSLDPKDGDVMNTYAVFQCRKGNYAKGEQAAVSAATNPLYTTPEAAWYNAGSCALNAKQTTKAESYLRKAVVVKPNFAAALLQLAELEFDAGNLLPSRAFLERFLQASAPTASSLWLAVRLERASGNTATAADYARRLQQDFPTSSEAKALLESDQKKN